MSAQEWKPGDKAYVEVEVLFVHCPEEVEIGVDNFYGGRAEFPVAPSRLVLVPAGVNGSATEEWVREVLERDLHEHLCACDDWDFQNEDPSHGCKHTRTSTASFDVAEVLAAAGLPTGVQS